MTNQKPIVLIGDEVLPPMYTEDFEPPKEELINHAGALTPASPQRNRFTMLNEFVDSTMSSLRPSEQIVWMTLWRDTRDGTARVSQGYIAKRVGLSSRSVRKNLSELKARGLVTVIHQGGLNRGISIYKVHSRQQTKT